MEVQRKRLKVLQTFEDKGAEPKALEFYFAIFTFILHLLYLKILVCFWRLPVTQQKVKQAARNARLYILLNILD